MKSILLSPILSLAAVLCLAPSFANATRCFPKNNLALYDNVNKIASIDEQAFNSIIDHVIDMWQPFAKLHGAKLVAEKRWSDSTVNASASESGHTWTVTMYGGLARRPEVTP